MPLFSLSVATCIKTSLNATLEKTQPGYLGFCENLTLPKKNACFVLQNLVSPR